MHLQSAPGTPRDTSLRVVVPSVVAQAFLWAYIQKGLFSSVVNGVTAVDEVHGFMFLLCTALAAALALGIFQRQAARLLSDARVVCGAGVLGSLATLLTVTILSDVPAGPLAAGSTLACLALQGAAFCMVFLAWQREICSQAFSLGIGTVVVWNLAAAVLCFLLTPSWTNATPYLHGVDVIGLAVAAVCLALVRHAPSNQPLPQVSPEQPPSRTAWAWIAFLSVFFLLIGMLSFTSYLVDGYQRSDGEDLVTYTLLLVIVFCMMLFAAKTDQSEIRQRRGFLALMLAVVIVAFVAFFALMLVTLSEVEFCHSLVRLIRRIARIAVYITLLVMVYRFGIEPIRAFALGYVIPAFLPKLVQLGLSGSALPPGDGAATDRMLLLLLSVGFFLTLALILFFFLNMDGRLVRAVFPATDGENPSDGEAHEQTAARKQACKELARKFGLTPRETEIAYWFSLGRSAQAVSNELCISTSTVNTHAMTAYRKLAVHAKKEIIELVAQQMNQRQLG